MTSKIIYAGSNKPYGQGQQVGAVTIEAVRYVEDNPGCRKADAARAVGPGGNPMYGVRTVNRAVARGLLREKRIAGNHVTLTVTAKGRKALVV